MDSDIFLIRDDKEKVNNKVKISSLEMSEMGSFLNPRHCSSHPFDVHESYQNCVVSLNQIVASAVLVKLPFWVSEITFVCRRMCSVHV